MCVLLSGTIYHECSTSHCHLDFKVFAWEWLTKRYVPTKHKIFHFIILSVCVQGERLNHYFGAIIFCPLKKFLQYWFIQTSDVQENFGGGGRWGTGRGVEEGTQGRPACQNRPNRCTLCAFLILSFTQSAEAETHNRIPSCELRSRWYDERRVTARIQSEKFIPPSSVTAKPCTRGCRKAKICQLNWAKKSNTERQNNTNPH